MLAPRAHDLRHMIDGEHPLELLSSLAVITSETASVWTAIPVDAMRRRAFTIPNLRATIGVH